MSKKRRRRSPDRALETAAAPLPPQAGTGNWYIRFAVAFLVIYLLLWLLAPNDSTQ